MMMIRESGSRGGWHGGIKIKRYKVQGIGIRSMSNVFRERGKKLGRSEVSNVEYPFTMEEWNIVSVMQTREVETFHGTSLQETHLIRHHRFCRNMAL